ncbi:MAG: GHKL domain-containing protein [Bacteroidales bacterium]|nr:GHKL domain-containing protein [Bacteroidales bacterium]
MGHADYKNLVSTIEGLCRVCYTCVRECPARAICIVNGQATVSDARCIACGNCIKVCSQQAKEFKQFTTQVEDLIESDHIVVALVAPSFPAEFIELLDYRLLVGKLKKLGFDHVFEVGFGADLVSKEYSNLKRGDRKNGYISSDCPAISFYIEHYHPDHVDDLAPIASPMVAMARVVRKKLGEKIKIVFIGPCIAKKAESDEVDYAITFRELRDLFSKNKITPRDVEPIEFDAPKAGKGAVFALSRGILQTLEQKEDISKDNIIIADGKSNFKEAINEFERGLIKVDLLGVLCCEGCIMGAGTSNPRENKYFKRAYLGDYIKQKLERLDQKQWEQDLLDYADIDLSQSFKPLDRRMPLPSKDDIEKVLVSLGKFSEKDHLNCGACGYETCEEHAIAICQGFAEHEMCLPLTIEKLHESIEELNISNDKLQSVQQALKQQEKLAHMGQLSAGIAHELNNPLGVILMYTNILLDECEKESDMYQDLKLVVEQSERCKSIVSGLLNFARKNQIKFDEVHIIELINKSLSSIIFNNNVKISIQSFVTDPICYVDIEQMIQVFSNLAKNAAEAMKAGGGEILFNIDDNPKELIIEIKDNGKGIEEENLEKIFEPFFTTKGIGKGTGLGLATIYGIIKMHKGRIDVESNTDLNKGPTGTNFIITIPRNVE